MDELERTILRKHCLFARLLGDRSYGSLQTSLRDAEDLEIPLTNRFHRITMTAKLTNVLRQGNNVIRVILVTTLGNQLIEYGAFPTMPWMPEPEKPAEFGLCGNVLLRIYQSA